jgi:2-polyprenyl-3-methyl-5-hydroxy-6-metoxy-1,4-benzoquinol methylase
MIEKNDIYEHYISLQLGNTHNLENIQSDYIRYSRFIKHNYIPHFKDKKDARIIDVGCGLGETLFAMNHFGFLHASGIDLSSECVEFCRKQGFRVEQANVVSYFKDKQESFDVIIMNDIIEHLKKESIIPILIDCRQALKPGGTLIIKTFNATNPLLGLDARYYDFTHEVGFTQTSLRQVLLAGGFSNDSISVVPSHIYVFFNNPFNYLAWFINNTINHFFKMYFKLNGRLTSGIFTKNIIAIGKNN